MECLRAGLDYTPFVTPHGSSLLQQTVRRPHASLVRQPTLLLNCLVTLLVVVAATGCSRPTSIAPPGRTLTPTGTVPATVVSVPPIPATRVANSPTPAHRSTPIRLGGEVTAPEPIEQPQPTFPEECKDRKIQGIFIVEAVIDETGRVTAVKTLRKPLLIPPCRPFEQAFLATIAKWRYKPATVDGKPVAVYLTVTAHRSPL